MRRLRVEMWAWVSEVTWARNEGAVQKCFCTVLFLCKDFFVQGVYENMYNEVRKKRFD